MHKSQFWLTFPIILLVSSHFSYSQESKLAATKNTFKTNVNNYLFSSIDSGDYQLVSYLLIKGANPNYCDSLGITALMSASVCSDTNITKLLIKKGAKVNFRNIRGESALQWAILGRQVEQLKILIKNNAETYIADINGISPLFYALGYYAYDLTYYLNDDYRKLSDTNISYTTTENLLKILLNSGVDINQVNGFDCTPLLFATFQNDVKLLKILCKLGANTNKTTQQGITPLIYATQDEHYGIVKQLIENGARVNYKLSDGNTALFMAVKANNDSIAELLIRNNALVNDKDSLELTPLHYAAGYGYPFMTNLLIKSRAAINSKDQFGNTPLITAVYSGANEVSDILIDSGADVNIPDNRGNTPLMIAVQFNDTLLISKLFNAGADLNRGNNKDINALSIAIKNNSVEAFKLLVDLGAKTDDPSLTKSYYQQSIEMGSNGVSTFLKSKGQKTRLKLNINGINIFTGFTSNENDFMYDFGGGIYEPITRMLINFGYKYRPSGNRELIYNNSSNYKLMEKKNAVYFSIQHQLILKENFLKGNFGYTPGISNELTWRYYKGLNGSTSIKWILVPSIGLYYQKDLFTIVGKWEAKYDNKISISSRFNLQLLLTIPTGKRVVNKRIGWLEN